MPLAANDMAAGHGKTRHMQMILNVFCVQVGPRPPTFGGQRRLAAHRDEPLLFEVQLVRASAVASSSGSSSGSATEGAGAGGLLGQEQGGAKPGIYRLPAPPSPFKKNLGE